MYTVERTEEFPQDMAYLVLHLHVPIKAIPRQLNSSLSRRVTEVSER